MLHTNALYTNDPRDNPQHDVHCVCVRDSSVLKLYVLLSMLLKGLLMCVLMNLPVNGSVIAHSKQCSIQLSVKFM